MFGSSNNQMFCVFRCYECICVCCVFYSICLLSFYDLDVLGHLHVYPATASHTCLQTFEGPADPTVAPCVPLEGHDPLAKKLTAQSYFRGFQGPLSCLRIERMFLAYDQMTVERTMSVQMWVATLTLTPFPITWPNACIRVCLCMCGLRVYTYDPTPETSVDPTQKVPALTPHRKYQR